METKLEKSFENLVYFLNCGTEEIIEDPSLFQGKVYLSGAIIAIDRKFNTGTFLGFYPDWDTDLMHTWGKYGWNKSLQEIQKDSADNGKELITDLFSYFFKL